MTAEDKQDKKVRILIVDDEADIRTVLARGLEHEGFIVESSGDPEEALNSYKAGTYDLILLDIRMPKMNGLVLYDKLREIDSNVRVCFITAGELVYDFPLPKFPRCNILKKPIDNYDLLKEVTKMTNV